MTATKEFDWLRLKAPDDFWRRLDHWCQQQGGVVKPSRPAAIRWIVHQFLLKQEQRAERSSRRGERRSVPRALASGKRAPARKPGGAGRVISGP